MTHSETLYSVRDEGKQEAIAEDILKMLQLDRKLKKFKIPCFRNK